VRTALSSLSSPTVPQPAAKPPVPAPHCFPQRKWEKQDFSRRVATFAPALWFARPLSASPLVCSLFGFKCVAEDLVECEACGAQVALQVQHFSIFIYKNNKKKKKKKKKNQPINQISALLGPEEALSLCLSFQERMFSCHKGECSWVGESCSIAWLNAPEDQQALAVRGCLGRFLGLCESPVALPVVATPPELDSAAVDPEVLPLWLAKAGRVHRVDGIERVMESGRPLAGAALLAVCGWSFSAQSRSVRCETCGARAPDGSGALSSMRSVGVDVGEMALSESLDPVQGHRVFCPWAKRQKIQLKTPSPTASSSSVNRETVLAHTETSTTTAHTTTTTTSDEPEDPAPSTASDPPSNSSGKPAPPLPPPPPRGQPIKLVVIEPAQGPAGWEVMLQHLTGRQTSSGSEEIVSPEEALRIVRETLNSATSRKRKINL
jgi:hypothetical protein